MRIVFVLLLVHSLMAQVPLVWVDTITQVEATDVCAFYDTTSGTLQDLIVVGKAFDTVESNSHYVIAVNYIGYDALYDELRFYGQYSFWAQLGPYTPVQTMTISESAYCLIEDSLLVINGGLDTIGQALIVFSGRGPQGHTLLVYKI